MEWVEAVGRTVDEAVDEAMQALGETSKDAVSIEVVEEPKRGFLGIGGQEARVRVTVKPKKRRRRGRGGKGRGERQPSGAKEQGRGKQQRGKNGGGRKASGKKPDSQKGGQKPKPAQKKSTKDDKRSRRSEPKPASADGADAKKVAVDTRPDEKPDIEEQAQVAREFAEGLLDSFGLEGEVETRVEDDILYVDIDGEQTEALVGRKGVVVQAVHELTRTVIQRKTFGAPRMRLDIAGYAARRREALKIYAGRLAETVKEDGREAMLEPMNAADRKVVHDAIAEIDGVRSYSEGEDPNRSVIVAPSD
ncbi:MAG: RNA-binding cell elongation regulator Jag/EloR [Acidimicrobiia bacterium]|nr:RNA-binding cell elongation regulator Jag/EloR [Acidimicrobiia bacterium]